MPSSEAWLLRDVALGSQQLDCRLRDGNVVELGRELSPGGDHVLDARGGALLPGLADHHIHVTALAAARGSVDLGGADTLADAPDAVDSDWVRVVGAGAELTRADVDRRWPDAPVRVQHRSGRLWTLNSAGVQRLASGLTERERVTGHLWDADARLRTLLNGRDLPDVSVVGRALAASGITHLTDATPDLADETAARIAREIPQHLGSMAPAGSGPRKLVLSDLRPPEFEALRGAIMTCHAAGRPVAIHTVTTATLALALAAIGEAGALAGDRLEHVALCDDDAAERIAALALTVVTQPTIYLRHREAFLRDTPGEERPLLWRHAGLLARGVRVAVSSDAPYGDPDPARTLQACATRPIEGVDAPTALVTMLTALDDPAGSPRTVAVGAAADLCLLRTALPAALDAAVESGSWPVLATFIVGQLVYRH